MKAHRSAVCISVLLVSFLGGLLKSMLFRSASNYLHHLKPVQIRYPGLVIERFGRLTAMLPDHPTAGDSSGDLSVGEVACLNQKVAYYEDIQRAL